MKKNKFGMFRNSYALESLIIVTLILIGAPTLSNVSAANTQVSLNDLSGFPVTQGETIVFSGRLIKSSTLQGIPDVTVNIVHRMSFDNRNILAVGQTDANGFYSIPWLVNVEKSVVQRGGSFGTENTQGRDNRFQMKVFAQFEGDREFAHSTSNAQSFEVKLNALRLEVEKATSYLAHEDVTVRIMVKDINNNLVDPDKITARFDNNPVVLMKQSTGTYVFSIKSMSPGNHQLNVVAEKGGHTPDDVFVTLEGMKRKTSLAIATDKRSYELGETVNITASVIDQSNKLITDRTVTGALIKPNLDVERITFVNGKASYVLGRSDVSGTWVISANFPSDNSYFGVLAQESFSVVKKPLVTPRMQEKVTLSSLVFLDHLGNRLDATGMGQHVMIQTMVKSNFETTEDITYISQVKDVDDITVALSWITSTLAPSQKLELAVSWIPEAAGEYTAEVFVWKSIKHPEPLSSDIKRSIIAAL
jgi:hypothetical protein